MDDTGDNLNDDFAVHFPFKMKPTKKKQQIQVRDLFLICSVYRYLYSHSCISYIPFDWFLLPQKETWIQKTSIYVYFSTTTTMLFTSLFQWNVISFVSFFTSQCLPFIVCRPRGVSVVWPCPRLNLVLSLTLSTTAYTTSMSLRYSDSTTPETER